MNRPWIILSFLFLFSCLLAENAYANIPLITRGLGRTLFSVLQIPKDMLVRGSQSFPLGLVAGTVGGAMKAVAGTVIGATEIARGAAPYAKYAIFAI